jgi:hypothetical protein
LGPKWTYPRLTGNTSGNHDDFCASKSLLETVIGRETAYNFSGSGDVRQISGNTRSVDDIEESQLNERKVGMKRSENNRDCILQ